MPRPKPLRWLSSAGIHPALSPGLAKRVSFTNQLALAVAVACTGYVTFFRALGLNDEGILALPFVPAFFACVAANRLRLYTVARLGFLFFYAIAVSVFASRFGADFGFQFLFFPAAGFAFLCFEPRERWQMFTSISMMLISFAILEYTKYSILARTSMDVTELRDLIYPVLAMTAFALTLLPLVFFQKATARAEEKLRQSNDELQVVNANLVEARRAADDANEAKSAFLADMSHELRTPLNAIIGYSELISEELADHNLPESQADLEKIHQAGSHLLNIINDILDLSKIEAGRIDLTWETFAAGSLVRDVSAMLQPLCERKHNRLVTDLEEGTRLAAIRADRTRLRQALFNLLSNANKFTENGEVRLAVRMETDARGTVWAVFQVSDTGIGMTPQVMAGIFTPFSRADAETNRKYEGTGLGLVISRRLCQMMGGDIAVRSEHGKGSEFTMRIPAHGGDAADSMISGSLPTGA
ncbi:MAG TPA: ATP-binding protein [Nannocystaceae bacterium]|nr:ATP-binding protein [Nannocystaceae bacterium]